MSVVPVVPVGQTPANEDDELRSFVYNVGFLHAAWSDTVLNISNLPPLRLHALFISQSPILYHHLSTQTPAQGQYHISLSSSDPALTAPAVSTALATLYGHPMDIQACDYATARGMLAAGALLGLEKIAIQAYELLLKSLNNELLPTFIELALSPSYITSGDVAVSAPAAPSGSGPYPPYTQGLLAHLTQYIYENFKVGQLDDTWVKVFTVLPFALYKEIVESPDLNVDTAMDRHSFANTMTKQRGRGDEQVLLAFGNGTQGVQVVRRQKKRAPKRKNA